MASPEDLKSFSRLQTSQAANTEIIPKLPAFPDDVKRRFPSLIEHEKKLEEWRVKSNVAFRGSPSS